MEHFHRIAILSGLTGWLPDQVQTIIHRDDHDRRCLEVAQQTATLHTNHGDITLLLFGDQAPKTVDNFVGLASGTKEYTDPKTSERRTSKFYDGLTFHRVIDGFMIQGGCPLGTGTGGPGYTFGDEFHPDLVFNKPYLLAMANAGPVPTVRSSSSPSGRSRISTGSTRSSARLPISPAGMCRPDRPGADRKR